MSSNISSVSPVRRRVFALGAALALAVGAAACGSDDPTPEVPEGGTGSPFNDAIIASESHDEVLLGGGTGEILVAVDCDPATGGNLVTVVGEGLEAGTYTGEFDPSTGVDVTLDTTGGTTSVGAAQMTLDAEEYTVSFPDLEGAVFNVRGCPN